MLEDLEEMLLQKLGFEGFTRQSRKWVQKRVSKTIKIRKMKELDRLQNGEDSLLSAFALQKCSLPFTHELRRILW